MSAKPAEVLIPNELWEDGPNKALAMLRSAGIPAIQTYGFDERFRVATGTIEGRINYAWDAMEYRWNP